MTITSAKYSPLAAKAMGRLKSSGNDIEVFVEDTSSMNTWVRLLRNFLPAHIKLSSVSMLGCRDNVLTACKLDQENDGRKKLYIIDADMDLINNKPKPKLRHLYRLRGYCLENYLLNEDAIVTLLVYTKPKMKEADIRSKLNYATWLAQNSDLLRSLFICYAIIMEETPTKKPPTVKYSAYKLLDNTNRGSFCPKLTNKRIINLYKGLRQHISKSELREIYTQTTSITQNAHVETIVSGKDYLIPPLEEHIKQEFGVGLSLKDKTVILADHTRNTVDRYLYKRLQTICS